MTSFHKRMIRISTVPAGLSCSPNACPPLTLWAIFFRRCSTGLSQLPIANCQLRFFVANCQLRFLVLLLCFLPAIYAHAAEAPRIPGYHIAGKAGAWPDVLSSIGLQRQGNDEACVLVAPQGSRVNAAAWLARVDQGAILIVEGDSEAGRALGFRPTARHLLVKHVSDTHQPGLPITWQDAIEVPVFRMPENARVFSRVEGHPTPLLAGLQHGKGAVLWLAVPLGSPAYARFPFLLQALLDLGLQPRFESRRLWAYHDPSFQRQIDVDQLARSWRQSGLAAVHVAAWYNFEPDPQADAYLEHLIAACHRQGILVYAWLELPHVSKEFWEQHPEWREKTALLKDANVDWRLLMNLLDPDCHRAVAEGIHNTLMRFDWDGVDLAELYFDGAMGIRNLEEFTPLNSEVRRDVKQKYGFDPIELFTTQPRNPKQLRTFLDYRAGLAARLQEDWIGELERMRAEKPHLDLVLTHVDDRFDKNMRDAIGADAARALKLLDHHDMTFIIEDPGTVWNLGPKRYATIARQYRPLTSHQDRLGVDINVVERDQVVYPTQQQTGTELAQLIHISSQSFPTVIYYSAASVSPVDIALLPAASAVVSHSELSANGEEMTIDSPFGIGIRWSGPVALDGHPWPVHDSEHIWIPAGRHTLKCDTGDPNLLVLDFNGTLEGAAARPDGIEVTYTSQSRALMKLNRAPAQLLIDGKEEKLNLAGENVVMLPRGKHSVVARLQ